MVQADAKLQGVAEGGVPHLRQGGLFGGFGNGFGAVLGRFWAFCGAGVGVSGRRAWRRCGKGLGAVFKRFRGNFQHRLGMLIRVLLLSSRHSLGCAGVSGVR